MLELMNRQMVGSAGRKVVVMRPKKDMSADEALVHAAWLVSIAEPQAQHTFAEVLTAVQQT